MISLLTSFFSSKQVYLTQKLLVFLASLDLFLVMIHLVSTVLL